MANGTETEAPTLPAPVEPPEYYTGFGKEFGQISAELQSTYKIMQAAEKKLLQPVAVHAIGAVSSGTAEKFWTAAALSAPYTWIVEALMPKEAKLQLTQQAQAEFDAAAKAFQLAEWKVEVMQLMPGYVSDPAYKVESATDIMNYIKPGVELTAADTAWLNQLYEKFKPLTNVLPEGYDGDVLDAQSKILNEILTEPKVEMKGVHRLTIDEIAKAFVFGVTELPAGMTEEDVRKLLSDMDLQDEELQAQRDWLAERAREWELESARMDLIRAGTILAETPELTPLQWAQLILTQPMMATMETMQKWWDAISRPISAAIMIKTPAPVAGALHGAATGAVGGAIVGSIVPVIGTAIGAAFGAVIGAIGGTAWFSTWEDDASKELVKIHDFYVSEGDSSWAAYAKAFNEWEAPWWKKMILDSAFDPLNALGFGAISAVGTKITNLAKPLSKGFLKSATTRIGSLMSAFENGYVTGADAVFKGAMEVVAAPIKGAFWLTGAGYTIPKTFTQMSRNFGRLGMMDIIAVAQQRFPGARLVRGKLVGISTKDFESVLTDVTRYALKNPTSNDLMTRAGTAVMEFTYRSEDEAVKFLKGLVDDATWDTATLAKFNSDLVDSFSGFVEIPGVAITHGDRIASANILNRFNKLTDLGSDAATKMVDDLADRIGKFKVKVADDVVKSVKDMDPGKAMYSIFDRMVKNRYDNLHSPLTQYMQQAGRSASWHSRVADRILYSARIVNMERKLVMPIARQQLLFTNLGPWNYLESGMRSGLGGAEFAVPRTYGGVDEALEVLGDVSGCPYGLIMMQRGEKTTVQAMVNPDTGVAMTFKGGSIPFITRDVVMPEKIPLFGGKKLGTTITIGNKKYFLGSFQDWHDMWADLASKQMAYDIQVHFTKSLYEIPFGKQTIDGIHDVLGKNRYMLKDIPSVKPYISDIERMLNWKFLKSPEAGRALADVSVLDFNRRYIGMQFNHKADSMYDIHRITKENLYDKVLDGSMFKNGYASIDESFAGALAGERDLHIVNLSPQIEAMKDQVKWTIANPAKNLNDFMWDVQHLTDNVEAIRLTIHDYRKITEIRKGQMLLGEADDFEVGSAKMLAKYMGETEEDLIKYMNQLMENAKIVKQTLTTEQVADILKAREPLSATEYIRGLGEAPKGREFGMSGQYFTKSMDDAAYYGPTYMKANIKSKNSLDWPGDAQSLADSIGIGKKFDGMGGSGHPDAEDFLINTIKKANPNLDAFRLYADNPAEELLVVLDDSIVKETARFNIGGGAVLNDAQLARLSDLDSITRLELENILATRTKLAEIEAEIPVFHKRIKSLWKTNPDKAAKESRLFWQEGTNSQRFRKSTVWSEFDNVANKLKFGRLEASRNFLTSIESRPMTLTGYRVGEAATTTGAYATEGSGLYIARNTKTAKRFIEAGVPGRKEYSSIKYAEPKNPLIVEDEILPSLMQSDIVFQTTKPKDSAWIRLNKQAAQNINLSKEHWYFKDAEYMRVHQTFSDELTKLIRAEGYDSVSVRLSKSFKYDPRMAGYEWDVLFDESLWKAAPTGAPYLPDFVPEVVGDLTPNHLAYLYGTTGDDLYRGLTRISHNTRTMPREDFIIHTREQASAYAAKLGTTADKLGFTDEAIGEVYDQLWRNLGVNPNILTPDSPAALQLEELRQEMYRWYSSTKIPESDVIKWWKYLNTVSDGVGELDAYKGIFEVPSWEMKPQVLKLSHNIDDIRRIASGSGTIKLYHGAPQEFAESLVKQGPRVPYKVEDVAREVAESYGLSYKEFWRFAYRRHEIVEGLSTATAPVASRWAQHFPEGEILTDLNAHARILARAKQVQKAGETLPQAADRVMEEAENLLKGKGVGLSTENMADVLKLPNKYALASRKGALVEIEVDISNLPKSKQIEAQQYLRDLESGKLTLDDVISAWNHNYKDFKLKPEYIKSSRIVLRDIPLGTEFAGNQKWIATKESAMPKAKEMHAMAYPTYDDANIIDETMRAVFPFWNYELFRWKWLPRTFMRTPGVMSGLARYMEYTDNGYVPVPGTDLQLNFLRGTVFMGGLRSMYLKDFPEFHDTVPGIEFLDYIGRAGFFPGIHVMLPVIGLSALGGTKPQLAELAPAWVKTSLSGLRALSPQHIGAILDRFYPDRFRDYMTMVELGSMGYDADEIWKKKQQGIKITPEEEKLWLTAVAKVDGIKGVLMNQTGLFRIRPQEFANIRKEMRLAIEEATGVPVATQEWIDKMYPITGKRFSDYFHLDIQQQALLYQWESFRRYQGVTTPLEPSSWQALDIKISDYYGELERIYTDARYNGIYKDGKLVQQSMVEVNRQLVEGIIGPDQWRAARSDMQASLSAAASALGESPAYKDVPKTFEERVALLKEEGVVTPTQTPDQELLYYYYELEPELKWDWESERMELDFDTYYAYIDILLETLSPTHRERLLERIQNDWTPMERLYWQFSREFAKPYRNLREVVMNQYSEEQRKVIRRYEVARGAEREEIQNIMGPDGKLIAGYTARLREARQRLRVLDPTMDAWLYFFGTTDKFMSHESEEIYNNLTAQYLVPGMIGTAK